MKKFWVFLLAFLYLGLSSGLVVNWHYCMGELASIELGAPQDDHCGKCGMKDQKGCCETDSRLLKLRDAHLSTKIQAFQPQLSEHTPWESPVFTTIRPAHELPARQPVISPPGRDGQKAYRLHQIFLI